MQRTVTFLAPFLVATFAGTATSQFPLEPTAEPAQQPTALCLPAIMDQHLPGGPCIQASTYPTLGRLYPMSIDLNVNPITRFVGMGTVEPEGNLHVFATGGAGYGLNDLLGHDTLILESGRDASIAIVAAGNHSHLWFGHVDVSQRGAIRHTGNLQFPWGLNAMEFHALYDDGNSPDLLIMPDGNVGIGMDVPATKLHVRGSSEDLITIDGRDHPFGIDDTFHIGAQFSTDASNDWLYIGSSSHRYLFAIMANN